MSTERGTREGGQEAAYWTNGTGKKDMERDKLSVIVIRVKAYKAVFLYRGEAIKVIYILCNILINQVLSSDFRNDPSP